MQTREGAHCARCVFPFIKKKKKKIVGLFRNKSDKHKCKTLSNDQETGLTHVVGLNNNKVLIKSTKTQSPTLILKAYNKDLLKAELYKATVAQAKNLMLKKKKEARLHYLLYQNDKKTTLNPTGTRSRTLKISPNSSLFLLKKIMERP